MGCHSRSRKPSGTLPHPHNQRHSATTGRRRRRRISGAVRSESRRNIRVIRPGLYIFPTAAGGLAFQRARERGTSWNPDKGMHCIAVRTSDRAPQSRSLLFSNGEERNELAYAAQAKSVNNPPLPPLLCACVKRKTGFGWHTCLNEWARTLA